MKLSERPEGPWALWAGLAGALGAAGISLKMLVGSPGPAAAAGFLFLPLIAAIAAIPFGIWGAALGHVVLRLRGRAHEPWTVFVAALVAASLLPAVMGYEAWRGVSLEREVPRVLSLNARGLELAFEQSRWRRDKYFLAALAQNPAADAHLLDRVARLEQGDLFQPIGSFWDVLGPNREGLAPMRLVARHPNTPPAALAFLAAHPLADRVLDEVLANPNTPPEVAARHAPRTR